MFQGKLSLQYKFTSVQIQKHCFFIFDQNQLKHRKISSDLFAVVSASSKRKTPRMPFSILIHPVIHYRSPRKKLKQETNTIFRGALTTQATSIYSPLREKCPNTEFFLVRIFLYSDSLRRFMK